MNTLVQYYRQQFPDDKKTDEEITELYVQNHGLEKLKDYPDVITDWEKIEKARRVENAPPLSEEFSRATSRGLQGLASGGAGVLGALSDVLGAEGARDYYQEMARNRAQAMAHPSLQPTFDSISDAKGVGQKIRYLIGAAGEVVPSIAESALAAGVGALAGSAAAPGPGTAAGGIAGFLEGQAMKSLLKKGVKDLAAKESKELLRKEMRDAAIRYGGEVATLANSYGLSVGEIYNDLTSNPNVDRDTALDVSLLGGAIAAAPDTILPSYMLRKYFKGAATDQAKKSAHNYFLRVAQEAAKTIPIESSTETFQELVGIAAERYADPTMRDKPLQPEEIKRLKAAAILGGIGGGIVAPVAGIPGGGGGGAGGDVVGRPDVVEQPEPIPEPEAAPQVPGVAMPDPMAIFDETFAPRLTAEQRALAVGPRPPVASAFMDVPLFVAPDLSFQGRYPGRAVGEPALDVWPELQMAPQPAPPNNAYEIANALREQIATEPSAIDEELRSRAFASALQGDLETELGSALDAPEQPQPQPQSPLEGGRLPNEDQEKGLQEVTTETPPVQNQTEPEAVPNEAAEAFLADIDFAGTHLTKTETTKGRIKKTLHGKEAENKVEGQGEAIPAYEDITDQDYSPELGERLTSMAGVSGDNKAITTRYAFFEDQETGEVVGLPVWYTYEKNKENETEKVYRVGRLPGSRSGQRLEKLMSGGRYIPVGSVRKKTPVVGTEPDIWMRFKDAKDYDARFAVPAKTMLGASKRTAGRMAASMQAKGFNKEGDEVEFMSPDYEHDPQGYDEKEESEASDPGDEFALSGDIDIKQAETLFNLINQPENKEKPLLDVFQENTKTIAEILKKAKVNSIKLFHATNNARDAKTLDEFYSRSDPAGAALYKKSAASQAEGVRGLRGGASRVHEGKDVASPALPVGQDQAGSSSQAVKHTFSGLVGSKAASRQRLAQVISAIQDMGLDVEIETALEREYGAANMEGGIVSLGFHDAANPTVENLRIALHEAAHAVIGQLPADAQARVLQAIDQFTDEQLGLNLSSDPRIRKENPSGLAPSVLAEERLAEYLALNGLKPLATNLAARIMRLIREAYMKVAMAVQRAFGREPSESLALAYVENRFNRIVNGETQGIFQFLIPPLNRQIQSSILTPVNAAGHFPRAMPDGRVQYPDVVPDSLEAIRFTFSVPEGLGERAERKVIAETNIAALNEQIDLERFVESDLQRIPEVVAEARRLGIGVLQWLREEFRLPDPDALKQAQQKRMVGNQGITPGMDKRISDFTAEQNRDRAVMKAYQLLQKQGTTIANQTASRRNRLDELRELHKKAVSELQDSGSNYLSLQGITKVMERQIRDTIRALMRDLRGESKRLGVITQQIRELERMEGNHSIDLRTYAPAFKKLFLGAKGQLPGKLLKYLDDLANDPVIDLTKTIAKIREDLTASGNDKYKDLIQKTPESKALLSTVVAYAKKDRKLAALLQVRKLEKADERTRINLEVQRILRMGVAAAGKVDLATKAGKAEQAALDAFRQDRRNVKSLARKIKDLEREIAAGSKIHPRYQAAADKLGGDLELRAPVTFGHGMKYFVPPNPTASKDQTKANPFVISLDPKGNITDRATVEGHLLAMTEWIKHREATGQTDGFYHQVKAMHDEITARGVITPELVRASYSVTGLRMSDAATQFKAFGLPIGRVLTQMIHQYVESTKAFHTEAEQLGRKVERARDNAVRILAKGSPNGISHQHYLQHYYSPAVDFLERQRDLAEKYPNDPQTQLNEAFRRLLQQFQRNDEKRNLLGSMAVMADDFMRALRKDIEANWEASQWYRKHLRDKGVGVRDETLLVWDENNQTVTGERKHVNQGLITISRTISDDFKTVFGVMVNLNWADALDAFRKAAEIYNQLGADELRKMVQKLFNHEDVQKMFFMALTVDRDTYSPFPAPLSPDGVTQPEADPALVSEAAKDSNGDVVMFAEKLYELHGGATDKGNYVQQVLEVFGEYFQEMRRTMENMDPDGMNLPPTFQTMVPGFMAHARRMEHWPALWTRHISFDRGTNLALNARVAAEIAFGIRQERLENAYNELFREVRRDVAKLEDALAKVKAMPIGNGRKIEAELQKLVGGKDELKRLEKLAEMQKLLTNDKSIKRELISYFRGKDSPVKTMRFGQQLVGVFSGLMLNQPGSALSQLSDVFSPLFNLGVAPSSVKQMFRMSISVLDDLSRGLGEAFGFQWKINDRLHQRFYELGFGDSAAGARVDDLLLKNTELMPNALDRTSQFLRRVSEAQDIGLNRKGEDSKATRLRPLAPFRQSAMTMHFAAVRSTWKTVEDFVMRGVEYYEAHPSAQVDMGIYNRNDSEWAKELGLGKLETNAFTRLFTTLRNEYGLDFWRLVREAKEDKDKGGVDPLSNKTLTRLQAYAVKEITSEGNIATMPFSSYNNSVLKYMLPLLGWTFRRGQKVGRLALDENGKAASAALAKGLLAISAVGVGGLAVSALMELYYEDLLNKKRNLRRLTTEEGIGNLALAIIEHSTRVGTLGLWGDFLNTATNIATGEGDNRSLSIDNRVVLVNSALNLVKVISNVINQDLEVDYANVMRPFMFAVGGNGALQYMQLANTAFGFDNAESRSVGRTNAYNWLRVAGREQGLEINTAKGGYSTPTPLTPHITRMVMAVYGDDPIEFQEAYREAVRQAIEDGKLDPKEFVKRSFQSRHPLRTVFRTALTEAQYKQILSKLPEDGAADVMDAVNSFNRYAATIEIKPFDGKEVKASYTPASYSRPSVSALGGFGPF